MDKKVAWLLDVDGVINVWKPSSWGRDFRTEKCGRTLIRYNQGLITWLRTEPALKQVQFIWSTTWCYYPRELQALERTIGLGMRIHYAFTDRPPHLTCAEQKVSAVQDALQEYERVIWTDDEEVDAARKLFPALEFAEAFGQLLMFQPKSELGLTAGHAVHIKDWLTR